VKNKDKNANKCRWEPIGTTHSSLLLCDILCAWYCGYPRTVLSLEQGLAILLITFLKRLSMVKKKVFCGRSGSCCWFWIIHDAQPKNVVRRHYKFTKFTDLLIDSLRATARSAKRVLAIVILSVRLSRSGTDSSTAETDSGFLPYDSVEPLVSCKQISYHWVRDSLERGHQRRYPL